MFVDPTQPQTEQQYRKWGTGRKDLACLKMPIALGTLVENALICSFQSNGNRFALQGTLSSELLRALRYLSSGRMLILQEFCQFPFEYGNCGTDSDF